jgi:hypothetical protein
MDDFTLGDPLSVVAVDVATIRSKGACLGLHLNPNKSEVISHSGTVIHTQFTGFHQLTPNTATLLGALLCTGAAMNTALSVYTTTWNEPSTDSCFSSHEALVLLKNSLGGP